MDKELLVFVPGLSARAPDKYRKRLNKNLENYALSLGGKFALDQSSTTATYSPPAAGVPPRQIVFREVVWGDIPVRLSEKHALKKFGQGFLLLGWIGGSLLRAPGAVLGNKYQLGCMLGAILVLVTWYLSIIVALPTVVDYTPLPRILGDSLRLFLDSSVGAIKGFSILGMQVWVVTSFLMGLLPITVVVDTAYAMKQYVRDEGGESNTGLVGEEARTRIANALTELSEEQEAATAASSDDGGQGGVYRRVTILAHSFGAVPVIEELSTYARPLGIPIRLITLGAPLRLAGGLRPDLAKAVTALRDGSKGTKLSIWHCMWSDRDYLSSEPDTTESERFKPVPLSFSRILRPSANHGRYFDDNSVAEVILD